MKKYILMAIVTISSAEALEVRYGAGDFDWSGSAFGLIDSTVTLDDKIISISESHANFSDSQWYIFGNIDIHSSDRLDQITDVADGIKDYLPSYLDDLVGIDPFPSSFELSGIDLDIGIGYDVVHNEDGYFGIGVVTGISTPFMEMNNYIDSYKSYAELLDDTSTDVKTYKLGVSLQAGIKFNPSFMLYTTGIYAMQVGEISNEAIDSSFDVTGTYTSLDIGLEYAVESSSIDSGNLYFRVGYSYKHWDIDDIESQVAGILLPDFASVLHMEMEVSYPYVAIGYRF